MLGAADTLAARPDVDDGAERAARVDLARSKHAGAAHHRIVIPSPFLIDRDGIVLWAHAERDFKVRPSTAQILAAIDSVRC